MRFKTTQRAFGFYKAETTVTLLPYTGDLSPYRTMFMSNARIVWALGRSPESAAARCKAKAESIAKAHRVWAAQRAAKTRRIDL